MRPLMVCAALTVSVTGCAMRVPEPVGLAPGEPHVSWVIMHGDSDNPDAEFACQSTGPRDCVLPASRSATRVYSDIHLYFHGAGGETTYLGSYRAEFLSDGDHRSTDFPIQATVRGDEKIANRSLTGRVTAMPGSYSFRITVDAKTSSGSTPIREDVQVRVQ